MALISTLTDNFDDNSIDGAKWTNNGGVQIVEANGQLELTIPGNNDWNEYQIQSQSAYDLTGSQATIKIIDAGSFTGDSYAVVLAVYNFGNLDYWDVKIGGGNLYLETRYNGGSWNAVYSVAYNATNHRYLRIRESGGTVYLDASTAGLTWNNLYSVANPFVSLTAFNVRMYINDAQVSATTAKVDDFNILPSAENIGFFIGVLP